MTRLICVCILSTVLAGFLYAEHWGIFPKTPSPVIPPLVFPTILLALLVTSLLRFGLTATLESLLSMFFGSFAAVCIYVIVLLPLLPLLRKKLKASTVAALWILPNCLYVSTYAVLAADGPRVFLPVNGKVLQYGIVVWLFGFCAVMLYHIGVHLVFRRHLMRSIREADPRTGSLWVRTQIDAGLPKPNIPIGISSAAVTPLSIGLFQLTTCLVLPDTEYSEDELLLIMEHELTHILRQDSQTKFFLVFCCAVCWFHPGMWIAMGKCAEDLELSCDEGIMHHRDENARRKYAELLLRTAGSSAGFTSCLSASAAALRYRLVSVLHPSRKLVGGFFAGLLAAALICSSSIFALQYAPTTIGDALFSGNRDHAELMNVYGVPASGSTVAIANPDDAQVLTDYLASRGVSRITGNYRLEAKPRLELVFRTEDGLRFVNLHDNLLCITDWHNAQSAHVFYHLTDPVDWNYVGAFLQSSGVF